MLRVKRGGGGGGGGEGYLEPLLEVDIFLLEGPQLLLVLLLPGGHRAGQLLHLVLHNVTLTVRIKYYSAQSYLQLSVLPVDVLCLRLLIQS